MNTWFPNAYSVEVLQALTSVAAMAILLWAAYDVSKDAMGVPSKERFGARWTLAIGNVHRAFFRLTKGIVLAVAGVSGLFLPPPPPIYRALMDSPEMRLSAVIVRVAIMLVTGLLLADAFVERTYRRRYVRALRMNGNDVAPRRPNDQRVQP